MRTAPRLLRAAGFTLLPVILAMSLIAAIAFLLNRDNGVNARMIANRSDLDRARYAAEAGLQVANYAIQNASGNCSGTWPTSGPTSQTGNFFDATYEAYATTASGSPVTLVSTGKYNGASITLTRANVYVYQTGTKSCTLQPGSITPVRDTYLSVASQNSNYGRDPILRVWTSNYQPLLKFDFSTFFPPGTRVVTTYKPNGQLQSLGAVLSLYQTQPTGSATTGVVAKLITQSWVDGTGTAASPTSDGATWKTSDGTISWPSPGVGYAPTPVATSVAFFSFATWDLTDAVTGWMSDVYPNYGVWLVDSAADTQYASSETTLPPFTFPDGSFISRKPALSVNYMLACAKVNPCPSSGITGGTTTTTLITTKDTFFSCCADSNLGGYSALAVWGGAFSNNNRSLVQFDLTSIPTTNSATNAPTQIVSAMMRLYSYDNNTQTGLAKTVTAYRVTQLWDEGTKLGTGPPNGATWNYAQFIRNNNYIFWTNPGGTYDATSGVTGTDDSGNPLSTNFAIGWIKWDVTQLMKDWFANAQDSRKGFPNRGVLIRIDTTDNLHIVSRENTDPLYVSSKPQLIVTYQ